MSRLGVDVHVFTKRSFGGLLVAASLVAALIWALAPIGSSAAPAIGVNTLSDSGPGSLRQAMEDADAAAGADTINFSVSGTIVLASNLPLIDDAAGVTIDGSGQSVTVDGNHAVRPFGIQSGAGLELKNITIANSEVGAGAGGAIGNVGGNLTLTGATITGSHAATAGAIFSGTGSTVTISGSTISGNTANGSVGGVYGLNSTVTITNSTINGNEASTTGGGVGLFGGSLTITNSTISGNMLSDVNGTGGGVYLSSGTATLTNVTVNNNTGGGISSNGTMTITNATVSGNSAFSGGGISSYTGTTLTVIGSTIDNNKSTGEHGVGGGISADGTVNITDSTFSRNEAANTGGGIFNFGTLTLTNSRVLGNKAVGGDGGGINNGDMQLTITNSTISGNSAGLRAGGIYSQGGLTLTGSTVSNNTAHGIGAGICCFGGVEISNSTLSGNTLGPSSEGAALWNSNGTVNVSSSTIAGNSAVADGGLHAEGGTGVIKNTILADNGGGNCNGITDDGDNISDDNSCSVSMNNTDPMLEPLAYNGGPTDTHALQSGSPAINEGSGCPSTDQRSAPRVGACDLGSFEFGGTPPATTTPTGTPVGSTTATPPPSGSASPTPTPTGTGATPTPSPTPTPTGTAHASATPTATFAAGLRGDGDCNQVITIADLIAALSQFAGVDPGAPCANRSNVDCDSDVDGDDALRIVLHVAGTPKEPPAGCGPIGEPA